DLGIAAGSRPGGRQRQRLAGRVLVHGEHVRLEVRAPMMPWRMSGERNPAPRRHGGMTVTRHRSLRLTALGALLTSTLMGNAARATDDSGTAPGATVAAVAAPPPADAVE